MYDADLVPVGEDQRQHIELTRDIARKFNQRFGQTFVEPAFYEGERPLKIMGLQNPGAKMSKSDDNAALNTIGIFDQPDTIRQAISRAVTDSEGSVRFDEASRPGISNLLTIFSLIAERTIPDLESAYAGKNYGEFKSDLADAIIETLTPLREQYKKLAGNPATVQEYFMQGAKRASSLAETKMTQVYGLVGLN
ncbi:MAG: hypothetical protein A3D10_05675 [Omnitrophica WOR_2 bacterium RIFCSPHIGHO2_02_FULL_48_11]|nr:MAG: hypothetical protein A3D10_05675 [Omnitrophica WOR_2 bacterium RIFCSPHIGHO2_02_FULL_48_11]